MLPNGATGFVANGLIKFCGGKSNLLRKRFYNELSELFLFTGIKGDVIGPVIQRPALIFGDTE